MIPEHIAQANHIIEVVTAFKNGKKIQVRKRDNKSEKWRSIEEPGSPAWDFYRYDYRVTPEPKVIYVHEYFDGSCLGYEDKDLSIKRSPHRAKRTSVKYIEVIED